MGKPTRRILLSGASGLIGSAIRGAAREQGMEVTALVRRHRLVGPGAIYWNPAKPELSVHPVGLEGFDAVVHLSGANVARRWTEEYRRAIVESRVGTTRMLCESLAQVRRRPRVLLCASAVGIYGDGGDTVLTEESRKGTGFLAETCAAWEAAAKDACALGIRVVQLRFGVVLSRKGGALGKMLPVFRLGLGGRMGSGRQWMSWISIRDLMRAVMFLMEREELAGAFNLTAPNPVTNATFTQALARAVHRPAVLPVPAGMLRMIFGAMADATLLASQRVLPYRLVDAGFQFEDEEVREALKALLR
ncbi:MAG: TIGR01777 family oxidoreductase [Acidobacteriaceae bacterium]